MKKILLFFLMTTGVAFSQQEPVEGQYKVIVTGYGFQRDHADCDRQLEIKAFFNDGTEQHVVNMGSFPERVRFDITGELFFSSSKRLDGLWFYAQRAWDNWAGCEDPVSGNRTKTIFYPYSCPIFNSSETNNNTFYDGLWEDHIDIKVIPLLAIVNPGANNFLPTENKIRINSNTGFSMNEYNWQYSLDSNSWNNLPGRFNQSNIEVNAQDILGSANVDSYHGQNIYIRQVACGYSSNVVTYTIIKSAPAVVSLSSLPASCYDASDGSLSVLFGRALVPEEQLSVSLVNTTTNTEISRPNIILQSDNRWVLPDLPVGNYTFQMIGFYNNFNTYSPTATTPLEFVVNRPGPVDFSVTKTDVWCNGGNDGQLLITASGGVGGYSYTLDNGINWTVFQNAATHNITNLLPGTYTIKVKDSNGCISKIQINTDDGIVLGEEKEIATTLTQPVAPVSIAYTLVQQPTFYGGSNGRIVAAVTGGTRFPDDSYVYEWTNSSGTVQTSVTTQYESGTYYITLDNLVTDTYFLTVKDKNFDAATNRAGCTVAGSSQFLGQPEPLVVTFEVEQTISCNATNEFGDETDFNPSDGQRDESQDGILVAYASGGVPFTGSQNNGLPYIYRWKKQLTDGTWINLAETDATAQNVSHGNYALNIEDRNGIRLGTYVNNVLVAEIDATFFMQQPARLELTFERSELTCSSGNNAWAQANVTGGTPPYSYLWTTGETSQIISGLSPNNYFVSITDARGCAIQGSVVISQPNGVEIVPTVSRPTCAGGADGAIVLNISGGTLPYTFVWNTGATTQNLTGVSAGNYSVRITDAQGCVYNFEALIEDNPPIIVDLGADRTLCNAQSHHLDISIADPNATYSWTSGNGFTSNSASVSLTAPGTYLARVVTSGGCIGEDEITITASNIAIDAEFLLTSQAYRDEDVILVNTSNPLGENTEWIIPEGITIVEETDNFITLNFTATGTHTILLKQTQGDCYAYYSKNINVEQRSVLPDPGETDNPFITEFIVAPNPSNGVFRANIRLKENSPVKLRLFPYTGQAPVLEQNAQGSDEYEINFNVSLSAATYVLILETAKQTIVRKIILF